MGGSAPPLEGCGCGDRLDLDLEWFFRVSQAYFFWKLFTGTKQIAKYNRNHCEVLFTLQEEGNGTIGCLSIFNDSLRFREHVSDQRIFAKLKNSESAQKPYGLFSPRQGTGMV